MLHKYVLNKGTGLNSSISSQFPYIALLVSESLWEHVGEGTTSCIICSVTKEMSI